MRLSRRRLLGLGGAGLALAPFVHRLSGEARGSGSGATRLVVFFTPNGSAPTSWRFDDPDTLAIRPGPGSVFDPLRGTERWLLPLTSIQLDPAGEGHAGMASMLTAGSGTSIDQIVADAIGQDCRFRSLELGVETSTEPGTTTTRMVYRAGSFLAPDDDPRSVYRRLYGSAEDDRLRDRRSSMLDIAAEEIAELHRQLGHEERTRLDVHLDSVRSIERSLHGSDTCEAPGQPDTRSFPDDLAAQVSLAVHALACDATRVVSLQSSVSGSNVMFDWLGQTASHHGLSHEQRPDAFVVCQQWYAAQFRALLEGLIDTPDPHTGTPLIESTAVVWVTEMGDGRLHTNHDVGWLLAGGPFRTGRHVDATGTTHEQVLKAIAGVMGVPEPELSTRRPAMEGLT